MKNIHTVKVLTRLKQKWRWLKATELFLLSAGAGALITALLYLVLDWSGASLMGMAGVLILGLWLGLLEWRGVRKIENKDVAQYLNRNYTQLENSTELLLASPESLNLLAKMQQSKISEKLHNIAPQIKLPHQLPKSTIITLGCGVLAFVLFSLNLAPARLKTAEEQVTVPVKLASTKLPENLPVQIKKIKAIVQAPAYTRLGTQVAAELNIKAAENSIIRWSVSFKGEIDQAVIVMNTGDSLRLRENTEKQYQAQWQLKEKGFYQILFKQKISAKARKKGKVNEWKSSDFFALTPVRDTRPKLALSGMNDYEELLYKPSIDIHFKTKIRDDYGITDAYIVATVSKGKGESVKFREQKMRFGNFAPGQKNYQLQKTLNLQKLGMAPGDELYFFVEAIDNKFPVPQKGRTEVYFVSIQDTTREQLTAELGTGLKKLPDYFRSQRQLIIDTEKLLRNKHRISRDTFEFKSNGIGVDQKILRLRYGKFLGEEYEVSINGGDLDGHEGHNHDHDHGGKAKRDTVRYRDKKTGKMVTEVHYEGDGHGTNDSGHKQWEKKLSSLDVLRRNEKDHNHQPKAGAPSNNPRDYIPTSVMHIHDVMEEATFFDKVLKKQLKQALSYMWESELRLRTNRPKESLPYQYKALKLIKKIQQKSRVYVERIGFEPPPVKEKEKRLKGELEDIQNPYKKRTIEDKVQYPNIRQVLPMLENLQAGLRLKEKFILSKSQKNLLRAAGSELAEIAIEKPGQFLTALQSLQKLGQGKLKQEDIPVVLPYLIKALWRALPQNEAQPTPHNKAKNRLLELYLNKLGK